MTKRILIRDDPAISETLYKKSDWLFSLLQLAEHHWASYSVFAIQVYPVEYNHLIAHDLEVVMTEIERRF